jgi:hypothetical protein
MSNWIFQAGPSSKSALAATLSSATIANATSMDHPSIPVSAAATIHFAAAMTAAAQALSALVGPATKARVRVSGHADSNTSERPGMTGSSLQIQIVEVW